MNLRRTITSLIAAGGLSFGLVSGALAAVGGASVTVVLEDAASTTCDAAFTGGDFDLGTWTWSPDVRGGSYVLDTGSSNSDTGVVAVTVGRTGAAIGNDGGRAIPCKVDLTLQAPTSQANSIALANFSAEVSTGSLTGINSQVPGTGVLGSQTLSDDGNINVGLELLNPGNIPSGSYEGSITILTTDQGQTP